MILQHLSDFVTRSLAKILGECPHRHITWPINLNKPNELPITECRDCRRRYFYDFQQMKLLGEVPPHGTDAN